MAIQIERNENGNCIVFKGSTQPVYWNNCLTAVGVGTDRISIVNDIRSAGAGKTYYEYFNVKVSDFIDNVGAAFTSQAAAISYINGAAKATPSGGGGGGGISSSFADNSKLTFGTGNDLEIFHDGTHSNIADVGTGNLHIASQDFTVMYNPSKTIKRAVFGDYNCSFFYGSQERVKVVGFGVTITGGIYATGVSTFQSNVHLGDDDKLIFGDDQDLEIFHNSGNNNTVIQENTGGNLVIKGTNLFLQSSNSEDFFKGDADGAVTLFYDDTEKFQTTGYGVTVIGIVSATSFQGDGSNITGIAYTMLSGIPTAPLTVNEFNYYQQYETPGGGSATAGPRISTVTPDYNKNPFYYGTQLKPGQEMRWTHHSDASDEKYGLGMWGGSTSFTPSNAFHTSLWSRIARFDHDVVNFGTGSFDSKGFTPSAGANVNYPISTSTELALAYNEYTNKLEVHNVTGTREVIATASTAEDGNPVSISFGINQNGALPGITTVTDYEYPDTWYVGFGTLSNTVVASPFVNGDIRDLHPVKWANYLEKGFEYRFTSLNTNTADHFYTIGLWNGATDAPDQSQSYHDTHWSLMFSLGTTGSVNTLNPSSSDNYNGSSADHSSKNTTVSSGSSVTFNKGDILCLNWSPTDSKLRLINETNNYVAIGTATQANSEDALQIYMGGKNAPVAQPVFVKRDQSWEMIAYRYDTGANPAEGWNWRKDGGSRPFVNMSSTRDLLPGQKVQIRIPRQGFNHYYWIAAGGWQGPTGKTEDMSSSDHVDAGSDVYWRWDSGEDTNITDGWDYNTSNSNYDASNNWDPGNTYEHVIEYRYRTSDNKIQWWDVTPDNASAPERIATTSNSLGGGAVRIGIMSIQNDVRTSGTYVDLTDLTYLPL